jgi:hypothetical protein
MTKIRLTAHAYTVELICVKPLGMHAISVMLNEYHDPASIRLKDDNEYTLGRLGTKTLQL